MTSASSFSEGVLNPSLNLRISIGSVDFPMDNPQGQPSMASNGLSGPPIAQNGAVRLPEGSLPDEAPANMSTQNPKMSRKRTKTGCLTCRKRRIKCGEERPICGNCVKSKRNCEGYNQRVVFRDPMNAFRPTGGATQHPAANGASFDHGAMQEGPIPQYGRTQSAPNSTQTPLPAIRPKPAYQDGQNGLEGVHIAGTYSGAPDYAYTCFDPAQMIPPYPPDDQPPRQRQPYDARYGLAGKIRITPDEYNLARSLPGHGSNEQFQHTLNPEEDVNGLHRSYNQQSTGVTSDSEGQNRGTHIQYGTSSQNHISPFQQSRAGAMPSNLTSDPPDAAQYYQQNRDPRRTAMQRSSLQGNEWILVDPQNKPRDFSAQSVLQHSMQNGWLVNHDRKSTINGRAVAHGYNQNGVLQQYYLDEKAAVEIPSIPYPQTMVLEELEDDYYDVDSDGDPEICTQKFNGPGNQSDLGLMMALSASQDDSRLRSFTAFLNEPNVLATYRPTATASPLMDPQTARVFCHFVTSTGPSLSIYERHPTNPSVMFTGAPVPPSQQALWTYTLPTLALNHQGLLHSMLALASLHIAKLQHTSPTPSLKHYHYALRRVAKAVGIPSRRQEIATFAASLLLGFYEVMTAEHSKWNSHLAGAKQLAMEIDFTDMTRRIKAMQVQSHLKPKYPFYDGGNGYADFQQCSGFNYSEDLLLRYEKEIDEDLVSTIMGWKVCYGELGHVSDNSGPADPGMKPLTARELEKYRIQCDLFWWYCKQDVYQSIVSSNCLLMPYDRWGHCPPRAPIGRLDAIYGTMDHLILLMGRIAEFAGRDQVRKREALKANGGVWMPRPGMFPPGMFPCPPPAVPQPTSAGRGPGQPTMPFGNPVGPAQLNTGPSTSLPYAPPMPGMAPSLGPQGVPEAFIPSADMPHTGVPQRGSFELDAATATAEAEWEDIKNAFEVFEQRLGSDFQPLSPEYMQPLSTPFGPALYYRTYSMACIWSLYYTGRIITARVHPSMPPAAMVAAGVAAFQTSGWAKQIGRVCAGLQPTNSSTTTQLNPSLGAALIESSLCLFFAGIQYQDAGQRGWTITKLRDVARLTGWQSSAAIASGCETAWAKAHEAGKGPPYQRTMDPTAKDDRVAGRRPDLSGGPPRDNNDRRFITINAGARVHWALGLLSVEEDMQRLNLGS